MNQDRFHISLREYVDIRFETQKESVVAALAAAKEAVIKAEGATDKRFDLTAESTRTLTENARLMMPRIESERLHNATHEKIEELTKRMIRFEEQGRGSHQNWQTIVAAAGVVIPILSLIYLLTKSH